MASGASKANISGRSFDLNILLQYNAACFKTKVCHFCSSAFHARAKEKWYIGLFFYFVTFSTILHDRNLSSRDIFTRYFIKIYRPILNRFCWDQKFNFYIRIIIFYFTFAYRMYSVKRKRSMSLLNCNEYPEIFAGI